MFEKIGLILRDIHLIWYSNDFIGIVYTNQSSLHLVI